MSTKPNDETPLMKQYYGIKAKYPGAMLLFRVGDFYETFGEDAEKASKILGITLTKRGNGSASEVALAGFPYHSLDIYLPKLVRAGQRVAVCDQLEDPKTAKGIVKRGVTELVTPGVSLNDNVLECKKNNYLCAIFAQNENVGIAFLDISTGEFQLSQGNWAFIEKLLTNYNPSEVLCPKSFKKNNNKSFLEQYTLYFQDDWVFQWDHAFELITKHFQTLNLKGFGIENLELGVIAAGSILQYLHDTEHREIAHVKQLSRIDEGQYVWLDRFTSRNLELIISPNETGVTLLDILDHTFTAMGGRLIRKWISLPLKDLHTIQERLDTVEYFTKNETIRQTLSELIKPIADLERLASKIAVKRITPRELVILKRSLLQLPKIKQLLQESQDKNLLKIPSQMPDCSFIADTIDKMIVDEPPALASNGNVIKKGIDPKLDELRQIAFSGKDYLLQIQQREALRTGIPSLKVSFNKVFGYYIEVTHAHKNKVPNDWIRKQTLTQAERYVTQELKEYEEKILDAEERILQLEISLYNKLVCDLIEFIPILQQNAQVVAKIDCLLSFATVALQNNYCKPILDESNTIDIKNGRHPVIEKQLPAGEEYVPNDIFLDDESQQILIITGPNMAGKSAILRQTALIVLMAQTGSFVPASYARIGIVDKVYTRVGASDNLSKGESTFMVEMTETASILNNISHKSLILMDEIGRGTSTYDGVSIAWSIVEYLHNHPKFRPKTLFATHYHELNELEKQLPRVKNYTVSVKENNGKIYFLRKLIKGASEHSFGIHVAQLAGIPNSVIIRAYEIMKFLEDGKINVKKTSQIQYLPQTKVYQMSLFENNDPIYLKLKEQLSNLNIETITPIEALIKLNELKKIINEST